MATLESGKAGAVKISAATVGEITLWRLRKESVVDEFGSSESSGFQKAVAGRKRASIHVEGKWDGALVFPALEGASATLQLYLNASELFSVPAVIQSFEVTDNIDTGVANSFSLEAVSHGAYTEPTLA